MKYISLGDKDKKEMMAKVGIDSLNKLFSSIPEELKLKKSLRIPPPFSEQELLRYFDSIRSQIKYSEYLSFYGGGAYNHFIPYTVDYLSSRGEFLTPYTPYQPEVSQGTLQVIFEYQTLICQLTGMDIANASLYDGASGAAEAVLMAHRIKGRSKVLIARTLHPQYREVIRTYVKNVAITTEEVAYSPTGEIDFQDLEEKIDKKTSAVVCQSPNFMGVIENLEKISELARSHHALFIVVVTEPISLGLLEAPGKLGADVVTGEAQSFGIPLSFGGPYLGFLACSKDFLRQLPGRIAGQTSDVEGRRGFVLTLSTREQHIRRERATSNICTNQAWCALRATIFLETLGREGMREVAWHNIQKANYALEKLVQINGVKRRFKGSFFNEFVLELSKEWSRVESILRKKKIIGGISLEEFYPELKNCALFCFTEVHKKQDIDRFVKCLEEALE
jgi:glycine dehydrogenase subunit 1